MMPLFLLKWILRWVKSRAQWRNIPRTRKGFDKATRWNHPHPDCARKQEVIAGVPAEWIIPPDAPEGKVLLYLHGGGYNAGTIRNYHGFVSRIALAANRTTLLIEYRLAPEHPHPAALEDAVAVYQELLLRGYTPASMAIGGDSAGGGLTMATLLYLRDHQHELPACAFLLSPWADLTQSGDSFHSKEKAEPMLINEAMGEWAANYAGTMDHRNPYISPLWGDLGGLCPIYIQVGSEEILLDDSVRLASRASEAGTMVRLEIYPRFFHVFQAFYRLLPTARKAIKKLGAFIQAFTD
ncbi:MAG: alpha/beta hydrolase [Chitinophagales bacterium]